MKSKKKILAIIPARANSKRLKNKNILTINGKPMIDWTIEEVFESKLIYSIIISTDIKYLFRRQKYQSMLLKRPKELCRDDSPLDDALRHAVEKAEKRDNCKYDYVLMTHCNIPIRKEGEIDKLIKIAIDNPDATSVVTGVEINEPPSWMFTMAQDGYFYRASNDTRFRRQDFNLWNIDGAIEIIRTDILMKADGQKAFDYFGDKILIIPHGRKYSLEIDDQETFNYVEYLMKNNK